eukprot:CAMPEP_0180110966 /NCGR_PEP_ID=MMETSP0985-20121206/35344_1 /TAXON_ID=483367 /ORGANISM="non described non described, Strain CCMP 2436" /LENGTH=78 /DNA_ID=CAMNT_0022049065 /DNA_START=961 /DNA_END=1194 /DNA_ORIENTATION=+
MAVATRQVCTGSRGQAEQVHALAQRAALVPAQPALRVRAIDNADVGGASEHAGDVRERIAVARVEPELELAYVQQAQA